jgi:peptidoglycan pentaglycine glycine transferase (the first glycine)
MIRFAALDDRMRPQWDALAARHPASGFMQSWAWSEFKELEGYRVLRLGLFEDGRLAGGAIAYAYPSPAEAGLVAVPDGPLLDWGSPAAETRFASLVRELRRWREGRAAVVRFEPRLETPPAFLAALPRAPVDLVPEETLLVELGPEEAMLARMKPKGRYNARLALRRGVEVAFSEDPGDVHAFYTIFENTARFQDFDAEPKSFFINLATTLMPGAARFAFARWRGITLAAALTLRHGDVVTYLYGGHLPLFKEVMASYALHWEILRRSAQEGARLYDFYGYVGPGRPDHPYDRFSRFKEKFGGRPVRRVGSRDVLFYDRLAAAVLAALRPGEPVC